MTQGQGLVVVYSELLQMTCIHTTCNHLAVKLKLVTDDISRNDFSLTSAPHCCQTFQHYPFLVSLDYFHLSPNLLLLLTTKLFSGPSPEAFILPQPWGCFEPPVALLLVLLSYEVGGQSCLQEALPG
jgi:hypothetical protein